MARRKTQRQARINSLVKKGFLKFEAEALSTIPMNTPYMRGLVIQRVKFYKREYRDVAKATIRWWMLPGQRARRRAECQARYEALVKLLYKDNKWQWETTTPTGRKRVRNDPWRMLRSREDRYRAKNPEYESPGTKRRRKAEADVRERVGRVYGKRKRAPAASIPGHEEFIRRHRLP